MDRQPAKSIHLLCIDPPYYEIVKDRWDHAWNTQAQYVDWLFGIMAAARPALTDDASIVCFGGIGKHGVHPIFSLLERLERVYTFRNWITWQKRRGFGKSHDYIFCREEILWLSVSPVRTEVRFNIPLTETLRGYAGFNSKYPAKSPYKRVSNVWTDIPELMRPRVSCQKPVPLLKRIVATHSMPGDTVADCFVGSGTTPLACRDLGRNFTGCDVDPAMVNMTAERLVNETK